MSKIKKIGDLVKHVNDIKLKESVVLCVGCFDAPIHPGHVAYLKDARKFGKVIVGLTPDRFVNKGPSRPMFPELQRAEMLAALEVVECVIIREQPTAKELISILKPNYYCKGKEFEAVKTPELEEEIKIAQAVNCKIVYTTDDVTYSSSSLINNNINPFPEETQKFLNGFKKKYSVNEILDYLDQLSNLKITLISESIIDRYTYGEVIGASSKNPSLVLKLTSDTVMGGGGIAIANHISDFVQSVDFITYLGDNDSYKNFIKETLRSNVKLHVVHKRNSPTICKRRFIDKYFFQKLFETYEIEQSPFTKDQEIELINLIKLNIKKSDAIIVGDFGHGLFNKRTVGFINKIKKFVAVNAQVNSGSPYNRASKYVNANFVCIDEKEARFEVSNRDDDITEFILELYNKFNNEAVVVTQGSKGSLYYNGSLIVTPSFAKNIKDRIGAGDALFSLASILQSIKAPSDIVGFISNIAGSQACSIVGNETYVTKNGLKKTIVHLLK